MAEAVTTILVFAGGVILVALLAFLALRSGGDTVIQGGGSMDEVEREAKARSSGIDHMDPGSS